MINITPESSSYQIPVAGYPDPPPVTLKGTMQGLLRPPMSLPEMGAFGSTIAGYTFLWATFSRFLTLFPLLILFRRLRARFFPEVCVTVPQYSGCRQLPNELYLAIETYLRNTASETADNLQASINDHDSGIAVSLDKGETVVDSFHGVPVTWSHCHRRPDGYFNRGGSLFSDDGAEISDQYGEKRWYSVRFLRRYRNLVLDQYLNHIVDQAREVDGKKRQRRLYTNCASSHTGWNGTSFAHPASFETLAMDVAKKKRIMDDLATFRQSKDYYNKIGKAWKRGYLLYGPPGTGKSTLVAAIANYLCYDVYDLDLSAVRSNGQLRRLLAATVSKSVLVVEDIDCSLQLASAGTARKTADEPEKQTQKFKAYAGMFGGIDGIDQGYCLEGEPPALGKSEVTLSGMLNLIDGLWSVSQGERIIIFTTNHIKKLDPALIRRGRMDVHVEMSYCTAVGLRILAKNYLGVEDHPMLDELVRLVEEVKITPADVAERLMPKSLETSAPETVEACFEELADMMRKMKVDL